MVAVAAGGRRAEPGNSFGDWIMNILGAAFIVVGAILLIRNPRVKLDIGRGKFRGIGGPILIILGLLLLVGVLP